jgi:probable HAF family extracellular repeat protein
MPAVGFRLRPGVVVMGGLIALAAVAARPSWTLPLGRVSPQPGSPASYTVTQRGPLPNGDASAALALNASGAVTGYALTGGVPHAFVWRLGDGMSDLGTLPGDSRSVGTGINVDGEVCGTSQGSGSHAFVWTEAEGMRALPPLATGMDAWALGINAAGEVAGSSSYVGPGGELRSAAVAWSASGRIRLIPVLDPALAGSASVATAINDAGQVTGYQAIGGRGSSRFQPFVWDAVDGLKLLARTTSAGGRPLANNASGQVLGLSSGAGAALPVSWAPTGRGTILSRMSALPSGGPLAEDLGGINDAGQIVYSRNGPSGSAAMRFQEGAATDLNALLGPGAPVRLSTAAAINAGGQIGGAALNRAGMHHRAYLLTPIVAAAAEGDEIGALGQTPVNLGLARTYVILSKAGITTTGTTTIIGHLGVSPIASTAMTGFGLIMDSTGQFSTSSKVTGKIYAANYASPTPSNLTTAVSNMLTAYNDAAGRKNPTRTELGAGNIGGKTIGPGLYKWSSNVSIPSNVTLNGPSTGVWIFQIAGTLNVSSGKRVVLQGGALARNIFWQVAGQTTLGTTSVFNGTILDKTAVVIKTGARLNGRALAQTAVTLDANAIRRP